MYRLPVFLGPSTHHLCSCPCVCRVWAQPAQAHPPSCVLGPHGSSTSSFSPSPTHTCLSSHLGPSNPAFEAFRFLSPLPLRCSLVRTGHFWGLPSRHSLGVSRRNLTAPGFLSLCRVPTPGQLGTRQIRKQKAHVSCPGFPWWEASHLIPVTPFQSQYLLKEGSRWSRSLYLGNTLGPSSGSREHSLTLTPRMGTQRVGLAGVGLQDSAAGDLRAIWSFSVTGGGGTQAGSLPENTRGILSGQGRQEELVSETPPPFPLCSSTFGARGTSQVP